MKEKNIVEQFSKDSCKDSEKWLDYEPDLKLCTEKPSGNAALKVSMDLGSTETRSRLFEVTNDGENISLSEEHSLSAKVLKIGDISTIKSRKEKVYYKLEMTLKDMAPPSSEREKMFDEIHFVKGALANEVSGAELPRPSKISKTKLLSTYVNILSNIALEVLKSSDGNKIDKACYHVNLALTLPPIDFKSNKTLNEFKKKLAGHYKVTFNRLGIEFNIKINESDIYLEKEPNAVMFYMANQDPDLLEKTVITIDGGGKSTDSNFSEEGVLKDDVARTGAYGGNTLIEKVNSIYINRTGKSEPKAESIEKALSGGILDRGGNLEEIVEDIKEAKKQMAQLIFNDLVGIIDKADTGFEDIDCIIFHGRLFRNTVTPEGMQINIGNYLMKMVEDSSTSLMSPEAIFISHEDSVISEGVAYSWGVEMIR